LPEIAVFEGEEPIMSTEDSNWRSPKRVALNIAVLYTANYYTADDRGTVGKAK
jgi:hypothetical protein